MQEKPKIQFKSVRRVDDNKFISIKECQQDLQKAFKQDLMKNTQDYNNTLIKNNIIQSKPLENSWQFQGNNNFSSGLSTLQKKTSIISSRKNNFIVQQQSPQTKKKTQQNIQFQNVDIQIKTNTLLNCIDNIQKGSLSQLLQNLKQTCEDKPNVMQKLQSALNRIRSLQEMYSNFKTNNLEKDFCTFFQIRQSKFEFFDEIPKIFFQIALNLADALQIGKSKISSQEADIMKNFDLIVKEIGEKKVNLLQYSSKYYSAKKQKEIQSQKVNLLESEMESIKKQNEKKYHLRLQKLINQQNQQYQLKMKTLLEERNQLKQQIENMKRNKEQKQSISQQTSHRDFQQLRSQLLALQQQKNKIVKVNQKLSVQIEQLRTQNERLNKNSKQFSQNLINQKKECIYQGMLQSSNLISFEDVYRKSNIVHMIQKYTGKQLIQFKLVYNYNPSLKDNIHQYIDGKPNLLLIVKLVNDIVIGGFSTKPLQPQIRSKSGFIFTINQNQLSSYTPKHESNSCCMPYDDYYLIFGNSEIRIRLNQDVVFSNFGIPTSYFDNKNDGSSYFLFGQKDIKKYEREVKIIGYECYQVVFKY